MLNVKQLLGIRINCVNFLARPIFNKVDRRLQSQTVTGNINKGQKFQGQKLERPDFGKRKQANDDTIRKWLLLGIPISTFCLGCWQVQRKQWKEDLIEKLELKTKYPAVPLPEDLNEIKELEFRKVTIRGTFDHSMEQYLGPRSLLKDGESTYGGKLMSTTANNSSGYLVVTPFILSDTKERILVNRGWVSFPKKRPSTRPQGQITDEMEFEGIVRLTEPRPKFGPENKLDVGIWFHRDVERMAEQVDCIPVFVDACVESTVPGGPIGGQTRASMRNEHLSYIITWFSLSGATTYMWYAKFFKKAW